MIGKQVTVLTDRPLGSPHPTHPDMVYPLSYGYVEGVMAGDGEEQDAYVVGVKIPLETFTGVVVAIIHRKNDRETNGWLHPQTYPSQKRTFKGQFGFASSILTPKSSCEQKRETCGLSFFKGHCWQLQKRKQEIHLPCDEKGCITPISVV